MNSTADFVIQQVSFAHPDAVHGAHGYHEQAGDRSSKVPERIRSTQLRAMVHRKQKHDHITRHANKQTPLSATAYTVLLVDQPPGAVSGTRPPCGFRVERINSFRFLTRHT